MNHDTPPQLCDMHRRERRSEAGFSLIEVTISAALFALVLMSTGLTMLSGVRAQDETTTRSDSLRGLRDFFAEVQSVTNMPTDLSNLQGVGAISALYDGTTRNVAGIPQGTISVTIYTDEATVPAALGGPQDLNFDGDANDNLGGASAGTDLQLIPMEVTLNYTDDRGIVTRTFHRRFVQTVD